MTRSIPLLVALALASTGCNNVAVLEGEVTLPARPMEFDELWVSMQVMRSSTRFEDTWAGSALEPVQLTSETQPYLFSLETEDPGGDLHVKVRFCRTRNCDFLPSTPGAQADPQSEAWFFIEQPFYLMEKDPDPTRWKTELVDVPRCTPCGAGDTCTSGTCNAMLGVCETTPGVCVEIEAQTGCSVVDGSDRPTWRCDVDKCSIEGCIAGTPTDYCDTLDDGTRVHICET